VGSPDKPEPTGLDTETVYRFKRVGGWLWILSRRGLFRWRVGSPDKPELTGLNTGGVHKPFEEAGGWLWIGTDKGLFRWRVGSPDKPEPTGLDTGAVEDIKEAGGVVWIGARRGLFRWRVGSPDNPEPTGLDTRVVRDIKEAGGALWIASEYGLYQIAGAGTNWNTPIALTRKFPDTSYSDTPLHVAWAIKDYGRRTAPEIVRCRVLVYDSNGQDNKPSRVYDVPRGQLELILNPLPSGNYRIVVEATDLWGKVAKSERPLEFHIYASIWEVIGYWLALLLVVYLLVSTLAFLGLLMASHRSGPALQFLTSPWVLRFGLYYGWALRNLPPLQVFMLARYFGSARLDLEEPTHPHVPLLLARPQDTGILSIDLLNELRQERRIWITGGPGTGKTDTVGEVLRGYFTHATSTWSGWRQYGFIPVAVRLRDTLRGSLDQILVDELSRLGVTFGDEHFASSFIRSAPLLIILDGVNEARLDHRQLEAWLPDFLQTAPRARILATSQTLEGSGNLLRYEMPQITGAFARKLLCAFLGENEGNAAYAAAPPELWDGSDELTAYEVRQVAELARMQEPVPSNRTGLYRTILKAATEGVERPEDLVETLSRLAWIAWLEGRYRLPASDLPEPLTPKLLGLVLARRGGTEYEFVHELMRAYLAASWAVDYATSPVARLDDEEVWRPRPSRRNKAFFNFLAELIEDEEEMQAVAEFALEATGLRAGLLEAIQQVARRRSWVLHLSTGPERDDYLDSLCHITAAELEQVIIVLGLEPADFPFATQRARANEVFARCRRLKRLPELRERIRVFYPDAPLFERYPVPACVPTAASGVQDLCHATLLRDQDEDGWMKVGPVGGEGGTEFADQALPEGARVVGVKVRQGCWIDGIELIYRTTDGKEEGLGWHGGDGGEEKMFRLEEGEYITGMTGKAGTYIDSVAIVTNKRISETYGGDGGDHIFDLRSSCGEVTGFFGRSLRFLDRIGVLAQERLNRGAPPAEVDGRQSSV
jgi:hypothetical protein